MSTACIIVVKHLKSNHLSRTVCTTFISGLDWGHRSQVTGQGVGQSLSQWCLTSPVKTESVTEDAVLTVPVSTVIWNRNFLQQYPYISTAAHSLGHFKFLFVSMTQIKSCSIGCSHFYLFLLIHIPSSIFTNKK